MRDVDASAPFLSTARNDIDASRLSLHALKVSRIMLITSLSQQMLFACERRCAYRCLQLCWMCHPWMDSTTRRHIIAPCDAPVCDYQAPMRRSAMPLGSVKAS